MESFEYKLSEFKGRKRRLLSEWQKIEALCLNHNDIKVAVKKRNSENLPVIYEITYFIKSICGVENIEKINDKNISKPPIFHDRFVMRISLPPCFPSIDSPPEFRFISEDKDGKPIPTPWHPNIRYFGSLKGHVCLNRTDTYGDLSISILRIADYLKYLRYHAKPSPPFPEDLTVAKWVREEGEPNRWFEFNGEKYVFTRNMENFQTEPI